MGLHSMVSSSTTQLRCLELQAVALLDAWQCCRLQHASDYSAMHNQAAHRLLLPAMNLSMNDPNLTGKRTNNPEGFVHVVTLPDVHAYGSCALC